ncbi:hypothetical protein PsYK624_019850 [Phanerochaete sordida]|uniref:Uncharacterized protein n=1 Tax=Phanerochaete sordida TaxID=48140 RepID=A0A9P3G0D9_9APHY|nr:hypothetical protein PsYK624_019850 [Phanerochaete sordida]
MAYNDSLSLTYAMDIWDQLYQYFITPEDAAGGRHPLRSSAIASTCQGSTTAGGIFFVSGTGQTDTGVNGETIGSFVTYAPLNPRRTKFSQPHLVFLLTWPQLLEIKHCTVSNALLSYNSGHFLDGLAEISSRNQTWVPFLNRLVSTTIPSIQWTSSDGIISEDQNAKVEQFDFSRPLKTFIIRGLFTAWSYSDPNSAMAQYIQAYTTVQYNALQDLATVPGSNVYSSAWSGPPLQRLTAWGQLSALEVMRAAYGFSLNNLDSTISPTSTASPAPSGSPSALVSSDSPSHFSKTALLGAVIGGVALLALVVAIFLWRRHQLRQILRGGTQHLPLSRAQSNSSLRNMQPLDVTHDIQAIEPIGSSIFADPGIGCSLTRPDSQEVRESDKKRDLLLRMLFGQSRYEEEVPPSYAER